MEASVRYSAVLNFNVGVYDETSKRSWRACETSETIIVSAVSGLCLCPFLLVIELLFLTAVRPVPLKPYLGPTPDDSFIGELSIWDAHDKVTIKAKAPHTWYWPQMRGIIVLLPALSYDQHCFSPVIAQKLLQTYRLRERQTNKSETTRDHRIPSSRYWRNHIMSEASTSPLEKAITKSNITMIYSKTTGSPTSKIEPGQPPSPNTSMTSAKSTIL